MRANEERSSFLRRPSWARIFWRFAFSSSLKWWKSSSSCQPKRWASGPGTAKKRLKHARWNITARWQRQICSKFLLARQHRDQWSHSSRAAFLPKVECKFKFFCIFLIYLWQNRKYIKSISVRIRPTLRAPRPSTPRPLTSRRWLYRQFKCQRRPSKAGSWELWRILTPRLSAWTPAEKERVRLVKEWNG